MRLESMRGKWSSLSPMGTYGSTPVSPIMRHTSVRNGEYDLIHLYGRMATRDAPTSSAYVPMKAGIIAEMYAARQWRCIFGCECVNPGKPNNGLPWFDERGFGAHLRNKHIDRSTGKPFPHELAYASRYGGSRMVETPASVIENTYTETKHMTTIDYNMLAAAILAAQNGAQAQTAITVSPRDSFVAEKVKAGYAAEDAAALADIRFGAKSAIQQAAPPAKKEEPKADRIIGTAMRGQDRLIAFGVGATGDYFILLGAKYEGAKQVPGLPAGFGPDGRTARIAIAKEHLGAVKALFA